MRAAMAIREFRGKGHFILSVGAGCNLLTAGGLRRVLPLVDTVAIFAPIETRTVGIFACLARETLRAW